MSFFDFWHEHYILAFFAICSCYYVARFIVCRITRTINVCARHLVILMQMEIGSHE